MEVVGDEENTGIRIDRSETVKTTFTLASTKEWGSTCPGPSR